MGPVDFLQGSIGKAQVFCQIEHAKFKLPGLESDCGISHTTVRRWLSVLEASFIIIFLRPHYKNFGKRLMKSPKLYFLDTGLLCYLLQIRSPEELLHRADRRAIFESSVVSEPYKNFVHQAEQPGIYFWRDRTGHEVDIILYAAIPGACREGWSWWVAEEVNTVEGSLGWEDVLRYSSRQGAGMMIGG